MQCNTPRPSVAFDQEGLVFACARSPTNLHLINSELTDLVGCCCCWCCGWWMPVVWRAIAAAAAAAAAAPLLCCCCCCCFFCRQLQCTAAAAGALGSTCVSLAAAASSHERATFSLSCLSLFLISFCLLLLQQEFSAFDLSSSLDPGSSIAVRTLLPAAAAAAVVVACCGVSLCGVSAVSLLQPRRGSHRSSNQPPAAFAG